jgi:hypothetical protein
MAGTIRSLRRRSKQVRKMPRNIAEDGLRIDEDAPNDVQKPRFVDAESLCWVLVPRREQAMPEQSRPAARRAAADDRSRRRH